MAFNFGCEPRRRATLALGLFGLFGLGTLACATAGATPSANEHQIIEALIQRVASHPTMKFVRNGKDHEARVAAQHLRDKYKHFRAEIQTADDFIRLCATRSEITREPYWIRIGSGPLQEAGAMMNAELARMRQAQGARGSTRP